MPDSALAPLVGGILVGGASRRFGSAKALVPLAGRTFAEHVAVALAAAADEIFLLGDGPVPSSLAALPQLPDAAGVVGPLAGILAALAARPDRAWLVAACDQPYLTPEACRWLAGERRTGALAVLPRLGAGGVEPFPGIYEPACRGALTALAAGGRTSLQPLAGIAGVRLVAVPSPLAAALVDVDRPEELPRAASRRTSD